MRKAAIALLALSLLVFAGPARATLQVDVNQGNIQPLPIAIPDFIGDPAGANIAKVVRADLGIVADAARAISEMVQVWKAKKAQADKVALKAWWGQIDTWRARKSLAYKPSDTLIKPQYAVDRLYELTKGREVYITTEVGQHQMWAAQRFKFEEPNRWMTSGGLGTMGYGLPAAVGVQMAHPDALVIDIAGEASVQMTMQEMSTAMQYNLPIKIFILNNEYMGMVRQWQQLLRGGRYSHSYSEALPDFVKMAEAFGCLGLRASRPDELDVVGRRIPQRHAVRHRGPLNLQRVQGGIAERREAPLVGVGDERDDLGPEHPIGPGCGGQADVVVDV